MNYICYIFGYGSLVNVKNRNKTCSTQGFPAIINKDFKYVRTASYPAMGIKKISLNHNHHGHDHAALPYEWIFSKKTQSKVVQKVEAGNFPIVVGLSSHERKMLKKYEINVGNTVEARIVGKQLSIKKTSGGLFIQEEKVLQVASISQKEAM